MYGSHLKNIANHGFTIVDDIFTKDEIRSVLNEISQAEGNKGTFRKSAGLFAIRQFLKEIPTAKSLILMQNYRQ